MNYRMHAKKKIFKNEYFFFHYAIQKMKKKKI